MRKFLFVILLSLAFFNANSFANHLASADLAELKPKPRTPLVSSGSTKNTANLADVLLSSSPTLTFSNNIGLTSMATDGTGGADNISDLDIQIFAALKTTGIQTPYRNIRWKNATFFSSGNGFNGITVDPDPEMSVDGMSALVIKSSTTASNFSLKSLQLQNWVNAGPIRIAGYNNGSLVNYVELTLPTNGDGVTKSQSDGLTPAFFNDIDEVRIYSDSENTIWIAVNNIQIGMPIPSPRIGNTSYNASTGTLSLPSSYLNIGDEIDVSKLTLRGQSNATYTLTSANVTATSTNQFTVTLNAVDKLNVNGLLNKNGLSPVSGSSYNVAAAANWNTTTPALEDLTSPIMVSLITAPKITSATYDVINATFILTGTNFVKAFGANNDITVNKFTIAGGNGETYSLSTTADVEITSETSATFTLSGADIAAVNALLNNNGTSSATGTTYNLAVADDWNTVITGNNIEDLTSNAITVSNAKPTIESATYDASAGVLSVTAANIVGGDTMDASKLSITGQGGSYTLTSTNVTASSATAFTITLNAADKLNINGILNKNGTTAVDATTFNLAAATSWNATRVSAADLTSNAITVSNVAAPTITSATYDGSTGIFTISGTGLVKAIGATNDITVGKFTITGENGTTHTLSTTGNVEIASTTSATFNLAGADIAAVNALLNKNGTSSVTGATYSLLAADDWNTEITGGDIADFINNDITVTNAKPIIEGATYNASTGALAVAVANILGGDIIDGTKFSITGQGGSYTLTSANVTASSSTAFSITLNAADKLNVNGILNNNGNDAVDATPFNLAAAGSWNTTRGSIADLTGNAITVSNVTAPTITSATYDGTTHVFTITGTGLVKARGATNDITVSLLTIKGEGDATRILSTTGNVEVLSATSFSITLAGADIAAVNALLDKNGTSSTTGTTYNLAAADDWNTLITGGNIADLTNGITVSNAKPTIQSATYNASTGVLAVAAVNIVGGDDIVSSKLSITGQGGSYTLTSANVTASSSTAFSINLNAADKLNVNGILNKNGTVAVDATTFNIAAAADWNIITASTADLTSNAITVSNVTQPTITSATYDGATGIFTITGTGLVKAIGATNDITVSAFTITGANGATRTLSTTTGNVEVASATSLSITLAGADIAAVNALLNKNGSSSINGTTYNLAAADDWNTVITGGNISDLTGNGITVSNAVDIPPLFTAHPSVSTICTGANTTFSATASNAIGYQWQVDQGAGFSNVPASAPYSGTTSAILTITGATAGLNGYIYRVVATGTSSTNSNTAALTVNSAPAITSQPSASTICAGANTTFTVAASNATGYQWQVDTGAGFANITNGGVYSGATTATLTLTGATAGLSGFVYRAVVTGTCTPAATSNSAALTVNSAPAITSQPSASTICASANTTFTVAASNATGYQWQVDQGSGFANITNGGVYSGATTATLTLTGATAGLNGYIYRVVATGACTPNTTSNSAALTVNSAPAITGQPSDRTISVGSNTTFSASASNATGYQWQVDQGMGFSNVTASAPYSGTTSATLTITGATSAMNGYVYRLVATGVCTPAATSNAATLSLPVISVSGSLSALSTTYGTASMASSFSVSAVNLANEITLTAPSGFELSTNSASGYANTILVGAAGDLSATTIYVRLRAGARPVSSPYSGNITLSTPGGTTVTVATASSTVAVKPITAVLNNTSPITKIYNGTGDATLVASNYGLNGLEVCDEVTVSGTASYSNKDFGIGKTVTAGNLVLAGIDAANYTLSNNTATTTGDITKRTLNVTAVANTKVYGSTDPELGYTFSPALLTGESFNGSLSRLAGEDVGDYDITMGSLAISNNYTIVLTTAKLSITPGALIVRADLKTKTYGDSDPSLTYTVIGASGTGNVFTGSLARTAGENVGSYSITQGTLALNGNYQMNFEGSELAISPKALLVKADDQSKYVGAANPVLTFSYSGFKTGETSSVLTKQPEISTTATTASVAGSYDITVSGAAALNYAITYQKGILTITDINTAPTLAAIANQSVCASVGEQQIALSGISAGKETGQTLGISVSSSNAALFSSLTVSKGTDTSGTLSYRPVAGATGTATITITLKDNGGTQAGGVDTYSRSFTITINPAPVVVITSDKGLSVAKGETLTLTANGGTSYVWVNASGIISGQSTAVLIVRPTVTTTYTVTATNASGCTSTQSITIQVTEEAVAAKPTNIMSPNGDGINDKWVIENLDLYPNNEVTVVDRAGRTIYSKKGYDNSWDATLRGLPLSEGTYYYIINYGDGKTPAKKGFITILNRK